MNHLLQQGKLLSQQFRRMRLEPKNVLDKLAISPTGHHAYYN